MFGVEGRLGRAKTSAVFVSACYRHGLHDVLAFMAFMTFYDGDSEGRLD